MGERLELPVVGGGDGEAADAQEILEDGLGEGRALCGVGAGAELVEEDEGTGRGGTQDGDDVAHVGAEGG